MVNSRARQIHLDNYDIIVYNMSERKGNLLMTSLFVYTAPFRLCWKAMGLSDEDLLTLEEMLLENPQRGDVIEGTGGARKLRIRLNDNRGKSGGGRVIYLDVFEKEKLYFLFAYPKNVQENLTPEQKKAIRKMIELIREEQRHD